MTTTKQNVEELISKHTSRIRYFMKAPFENSCAIRHCHWMRSDNGLHNDYWKNGVADVRESIHIIRALRRAIPSFMDEKKEIK